jgi:hypothetical protein
MFRSLAALDNGWAPRTQHSWRLAEERSSIWRIAVYERSPSAETRIDSMAGGDTVSAPPGAECGRGAA